jgi:hypothetical protein
VRLGLVVEGEVHGCRVARSGLGIVLAPTAVVVQSVGGKFGCGCKFVLFDGVC